MENLRKIITKPFSELEVSLNDENWNGDVPSRAGWYYFSTNAPYSAFTSLESPPSEYANAEGEMKKCRNYNLSARANAHGAETEKNSLVISGDNIYPVYSGFAKNLRRRSSEHTFAHPGTAGLALARYGELLKYDWYFYYKSLDDGEIDYTNRDVVLKMGEQIWRSIHGWPLLCSS